MYNHTSPQNEQHFEYPCESLSPEVNCNCFCKASPKSPSAFNANVPESPVRSNLAMSSCMTQKNPPKLLQSLTLTFSKNRLSQTVQSEKFIKTTNCEYNGPLKLRATTLKTLPVQSQCSLPDDPASSPPKKEQYSKLCFHSNTAKTESLVKPILKKTTPLKKDTMSAIESSSENLTMSVHQHITSRKVSFSKKKKVILLGLKSGSYTITN